MSKRRNRNMCVRIARDVLAQLRLGRYIAEAGTYVAVETKDGYLGDGWTDLNPNHSFKTVFKKNKDVSCRVCALGSAFVSLVNIQNKCSVGEIQENNQMFNRLAKYFGNDNIALMESAFECATMDHVSHNLYQEDIDLAIEFGRRYDDETQRLRAIMLNVIRNNGDFKIPVKMRARAAALAEALDAGNDSW